MNAIIDGQADEDRDESNRQDVEMPDRKRQAIVDSWPADVDDTAARRDWGFQPRYDFARAFSEYLIPTIRRRYSQ